LISLKFGGFLGLFLHRPVILGRDLRQAADETNDVPKLLILMRGAKCGHSGHFDTILDDTKQLRIAPFFTGFSEVGSSGPEAFADVGALLPQTSTKPRRNYLIFEGVQLGTKARLSGLLAGGWCRMQAMRERKQNSGKWSAEVTRHSNALDLEADIFESDNPVEIAQSLQRSAERSSRRKSAPFRSAMSMLTFYINRAGKNLSGDRRKILEAAKSELRKVFGRKEK
jgi:hypothetical protein